MHNDPFNAYPGNSVAQTADELRTAAAYAAVLGSADAAAFVDRSRFYSDDPDLRDMAENLSRQIGTLHGATPSSAIKSGERGQPNRKPRTSLPKTQLKAA